MEITTVKTLIEENLADSQAFVQGDGRHFEAVVVCAAFAGLNSLKKQQMVYSALGNSITDGHIHALSLKTYTPDEWAVQE